MFVDIPNSALSNLVEIIQKGHAIANEMLVKVGDPGTAMYIIVEGKGRYDTGCKWTPMSNQRFSARNSVNSSEGSSARRQYQILSGHSFGEEILFGLEESYRYTVVTIIPTSYDWISEDGFKDHFRSLPELREQMLAGFLKGRDISKKDVLQLEKLKAIARAGSPDSDSDTALDQSEAVDVKATTKKTVRMSGMQHRSQSVKSVKSQGPYRRG
jgi:CRP-like cAMP-binding protein